MLTAPPPQLRVSLHLTGYGEIDFIPSNRNVTVSAIAPNLCGKIVTLPVDGAYEVKVHDGRTEIRGTAGGGYVLLRFALRDESLPGHLAQTDLAHFTGYVQRGLREVNVPAPIGDTTAKAPIVEVLCTDASGHSLPVIPGVPLHIPFAQRDSCRLVVHPNRIPAEDGEQRLDVDVSVTSVGGSSRSDGHFPQRLILSHGGEQRVIWLHGVKSKFDKITVHLTHVTEESQYIRGGSGQLEVPSVQWTIVAENTRWRFYATISIPVELFRFSNDPNGAGTGPLTLNLGVLSRFTWVTRDGIEGILGLEGGVMGMGLSTDNTRQLNIAILCLDLALGCPSEIQASLHKAPSSLQAVCDWDSSAGTHINPAIFGPRGFIGSRRVHFAARTRYDSGGRHASAHYDLLDAVSTPSTQRQIVIIVASRIGMPNKLHGMPFELAVREASTELI